MNLNDYNIKVIASNVRDERLRNLLERYDDRIIVKSDNIAEFDLGVFRVLDNNGSYNFVENINGRSMRIYKNDYIIAAFGSRYSAQNLCGHLETVDSSFKYFTLLTNGGIVGICDESPIYKGSPTRLECCGLLYYEGEKLNTLNYYKKQEQHFKDVNIPLVLVCGTSGETGKTTTAITLIKQLTENFQLNVAGIKISGTGCMEDILEHKDAGSKYIADLSSAGVISSYTSYDNVKFAINEVLVSAKSNMCDVCVCECGGDIIGGNVFKILQDEDLIDNIIGITLNYNDVMGIMSAINLFNKYKVNKEILIIHNLNHNIFGDKYRMQQWNILNDAFNFNVEHEKLRLAETINNKLDLR